MNPGELFDKYGSDKNKAHSYGPAYEKLLAPYRESATAVLEVGIARGASILAWRDYFPAAVIWGMDLSSNLVEGDRVKCVRADSRSADSVRAALGEAAFDVIVDDGDHHPDAQHATRAALWPYLKPGGIYVVEDVQWQESYPGFVAAGAEVIDLRGVKGKHDDVMMVFRKG